MLVVVIISIENKADLGGTREQIGLAPFLPAAAKEMKELFEACARIWDMRIVL